MRTENSKTTQEMKVQKGISTAMKWDIGELPDMKGIRKQNIDLTDILSPQYFENIMKVFRIAHLGRGVTPIRMTTGHRNCRLKFIS